MTVFKRIIDKDLPAFVVYEDGRALAFLDTTPLVAGHTLVIPKQEYKDLFDMPPEELSHVINAAKRVAELLRQRLGCEGVNILHASGAAAQQSVFHFHLHVIPRRAGDGLNTWPQRDGKPADLEHVHRQLTAP